MGTKVHVAWKRLRELRDDPRVGQIVRHIDATEDLHHIRMTIAVRRMQPGAAYLPVQVRTAPTLSRIFSDLEEQLRSYVRSRFWLQESHHHMRKYPALLGL